MVELEKVDNKAHLVGFDAIKKFIFAGNARFTLRSTKTYKHFTYRVKKSKHPNVNAHYFVYADRGDYIGDVFADTMVFKPKYGVSGTNESILPFNWFMHHVGNTQLEIWHEGICGKCGRLLTDPVSIARGLGPECAGVKKPSGVKLQQWTLEDFREW